MLYRIIGVDGKEYGPVTTEILRQWIAQGRANAQTRTLWENGTGWQPLGTLPEFANLFSAPPAIAPTLAGTARKTNGFATSGLICSIASWCCCFLCYGFPLNILGIVFSAIALAQINRHPERFDGHGLAIAGLVVSIVNLVLFIALLIWALATNSIHFHSNWNLNQFGQ
jgi:hypothetical protein